MASQEEFFGGNPNFSVIANSEEEFREQESSRISTTEKVLKTTQKVAREVPGAVLFTLGDFFGTLVGGPVGGAAGAALGAGVGETLVQGAELIGGQRKEIDKERIGKEAATAGAIAAITPPVISTGVKLSKGVLKVGGKAIGPFKRIAKQGFTGIRKVLPGLTDETTILIKQFPNEIEKLATQKSLPANPIIDDLVKAESIIRKKASERFGKEIKDIRALGAKFKLDANLFEKRVKQVLQTEDLNVKVIGDKLDFSQSAFGSRTTKKAVTNTINEIRTSIPIIKDVDSLRLLKKRLFDNLEESKRGFNKAPQALRAVEQIIELVDDLLPEVLKKTNKAFSKSKNLADFIKNELVPTDKSGNVAKTAISKINKLISSEEVKALFEGRLKDIEKESGITLGKNIDILSAAREINPNLIQQDIGGVFKGVQKAANPIIGQSKLEAAKISASDAVKTMKFVQENIGISMREFLTKAKGLKDAGIKLGLFELLTDFLIEQDKQ